MLRDTNGVCEALLRTERYRECTSTSKGNLRLLYSQSHGSHGGTFFQAGRNGAAEVVQADWLG